MSKPGDEVQEGSRRLSANGSSHISLSRVQGDHGGDVGPEEDSLPASSKSKKSSVLFPSGLSACGGRYVQNVLYCIHHGLQRFIDFLSCLFAFLHCCFCSAWTTVKAPSKGVLFQIPGCLDLQV